MGEGPGGCKGLVLPPQWQPPKCLRVRALQEGFFSSLSFPHFLLGWFPHSQSPVAAFKSFVRLQTLLSEGREAHPGEWYAEAGTCPTGSPGTNPSQRVCPWLTNTGPRRFWALQYLSLQSVHAPFLAVVENKFHSKVSNHFTRMRDL